MKNFDAKAIINNKPEHPLSRWVVARAVCGELWFWGSWDDRDAACRVAKQFENGVVLEIEDYECSE